VSQRSTRRRLRVEQKALRHSVRGAVHLSMLRVLGMHRSSTTSALEPSASVISLCQSSSFGHAQSCTGCLASPKFVRSRNRSGEPRHDHPHELASRIQRRRLVSSKRGPRAMPMPRRCQMRRLTVCGCTGPYLALDGKSRRCNSFGSYRWYKRPSERVDFWPGFVKVCGCRPWGTAATRGVGRRRQTCNARSRGRRSSQLQRGSMAI
jgi:hypothetical protein